MPGLCGVRETEMNRPCPQQVDTKIDNFLVRWTDKYYKGSQRKDI